MAETQVVDFRCAACGADLPVEGAPCPSCVSQDDGVPPEAVVLEHALTPAECAPDDMECARGPLWMRVAAALLYLCVGATCFYGSLSFFSFDVMTSSDWVFGAMGIFLALIALLGIKESLFPTEWHPE
jgi:hypothetical protein